MTVQQYELDWADYSRPGKKKRDDLVPE